VTTDEIKLAQLEDELERAQRAFRQDPTPRIAAAMRRIAAAIKYRKDRIRRARMKAQP